MQKDEFVQAEKIKKEPVVSTSSVGNTRRRNGNGTTMAAVRCTCGKKQHQHQPQQQLPHLHIQHPPTPLAFYAPCIYHGHNSKPLLRRPFSPPCRPIHLDWPTVKCVCEISTTIFHCAHHCCNDSTRPPNNNNNRISRIPKEPTTKKVSIALPTTHQQTKRHHTRLTFSTNCWIFPRTKWRPICPNLHPGPLRLCNNHQCWNDRRNRQRFLGVVF